MPEADHSHEETADCREAVERLYWYLDGELTVERRLTIQRHLDACHDCIEAYEFEAELRMAISRSCRETVPESLVLRVAQALSIESSGR
jgi:mycothiol system anti-sigma-R factor